MANFTHEIGNLTTMDGMILSKKTTHMNYYANNPCIIIDKDSGTLLKMGDTTTNPLDDYLKMATDKYRKAGFDDMADAMVLINFDRYATLDIEEICTLMNYFMNSIGPEKMRHLLNADETELKTEIEKLAEIGW